MKIGRRTQRHRLRLVVAHSLLALAGCDAIGSKNADTHIEEGLKHEAARDWRAAQISYKSALQQTPEDKRARLLLARAYLQTGLGAEAEKELRQAMRLGVAPASVLHDLGDALLLAGKYQELLQEIEPEMAEGDRQRARFISLRADAQYGLRQLRAACAGYVEAERLDPELDRAQWGLANCEALQGKIDEADARLRKLMAREPQAGSHALRLGDILLRHGRLQPAEAAYTQALERAPELAQAWIGRATVRLAQGNKTGALADIEAARQRAPKSPLINALLAQLDFQEGRYAAARDKLQPVLGPLHWHYPTVLLHGHVALQLGEYGTAESQFARLLPLTPDDARLRRLLALSQLRQGMADRAWHTLQPLLEATEPEAAILALIGETLAARGDFAQALGYLHRARALLPEDRDLRLLIARVQLASGEHAAALQELQQLSQASQGWGVADQLYHATLLALGEHTRLEQALANLPPAKRKDNPEIPVLAAQSAAAQGRKDVARAALQHALRIRPGYPAALFNLAFLELQDKRPDVARRLYDDVLKQRPDDLDALLGRAAVELAVGKPDEAVRWWERAAGKHPRATLPRLRLAEWHLTHLRTDKALALTRELLTLVPDHPPHLALHARVLQTAGDYASAKSVLARLTDLQPRETEHWIRLAGVQKALGEYDDARKSLVTAERLAPQSFAPGAARVALELAAGRRNEALQIALDLQRRHASLAEAQVLAGDVLYLHGRHGEAVRAYEQAQRLAPAEPVLISLFKALRAAGRPQQAERVLADWVATHPQDRLARLYLAVLYRDSGRGRTSLPHFEYLINTRPEDALTLNELALAYHALGDPRALETAKRAHSLAPNAAVADTLATILLDLGKVFQALEVLEPVKSSLQQQPAWRLTYARALKATGREMEARRELEALAGLKADLPERTEARRLLGGM